MIDFVPRRDFPAPAGEGTRWLKIFSVVVLIHVALIGGPLLWNWVHGKFSPPKENAFKVKLGGSSPSHAEVVGQPERLRPSPNPRPASPPAEPVVKVPPKPKPVPPKEPVVKVPPKPKPVPKEPVVKPKPRPKPGPKSRPAPKEPVVKPRQKTSDRPRRPSTIEEAQKQVYQPAGGSNFNRNVKIGSRDAGQAKGRPDNRTPQGGLTKDEEAYYANLKKFLDHKWVEPSLTHLDGVRPKTTIELRVAADGRVLEARIIEPSGNRPMDDSIRRLIKVLDRVPTPPDGELRIYVQMEVK